MLIIWILYVWNHLCMSCRNDSLQTAPHSKHGTATIPHMFKSVLCTHTNICAGVCVFADGFHSDICSRGELAVASHPVDCIIVYIYCTNTLSRLLCLSHKAHPDLHGDSWAKENENIPNPKEEDKCLNKALSWTDDETSSTTRTPVACVMFE